MGRVGDGGGEAVAPAACDDLVVVVRRDLAGEPDPGQLRHGGQIGQELGFSVFSRNNSVRGTRKLFRGALGIEIEVGGVSVRTGDTVVGDADGVVVLPAMIASAVVEQSDARVRKEEEIIRRLRAGETTFDVYDLGGGLDD